MTFGSTSGSRHRREPGMLLALGAGAEMVPDDEENYRGGENERGDGVDLRSNTAAEAAPDFHRQRVVAADEEECDRDFVHGERENEEAGGNEREPEIGKRDQPEGPPWSRTEIERGFFLTAVHFLQAGKDFRGGDGNKRGAVAEEDQRQAALEAGKHGEHQHG